MLVLRVHIIIGNLGTHIQQRVLEMAGMIGNVKLLLARNGGQQLFLVWDMRYLLIGRPYEMPHAPPMVLKNEHAQEPTAKTQKLGPSPHQVTIMIGFKQPNQPVPTQESNPTNAQSAET